MGRPMQADPSACRLSHIAAARRRPVRPGTGALEGRSMLTLVPCPDCGVPAEVTERFSLASTDGPVLHVALRCAAGHHFRMPVDGLSAQAQVQLAAPETGAGHGAYTAASTWILASITMLSGTFAAVVRCVPLTPAVRSRVPPPRSAPACRGAVPALPGDHAACPAASRTANRPPLPSCGTSPAIRICVAPAAI
jgi:hypothetical protein